MNKEYARTCGKCKKDGGSMFARMFYQKVNGKWIYLCKNCWGQLTDDGGADE